MVRLLLYPAYSELLFLVRAVVALSGPFGKVPSVDGRSSWTGNGVLSTVVPLPVRAVSVPGTVASLSRQKPGLPQRLFYLPFLLPPLLASLPDPRT